MAKPLDPAIAEILKGFGFDRSAVWDCHGVIVVYHRVLEQIAAKAGIRFDMPIVLEANGPAKSAALCVTGHLNDRCEWSIGEAAPGNNKNSYPFAMAEKRAKDRVILKLIGLHGLYSEEEAEDFKASAPTSEAAPKPISERAVATVQQPAERHDDLNERIAAGLISALKLSKTVSELQDWRADANTKASVNDLPRESKAKVVAAYEEKMRDLVALEAVAA